MNQRGGKPVLIELPEERAGELMVFRTFEDVSYGFSHEHPTAGSYCGQSKESLSPDREQLISISIKKGASAPFFLYPCRRWTKD